MYDPRSAASAHAREVVELLRAGAAEEVSRASSNAAMAAQLGIATAQAESERRADAGGLGLDN